MVLSALMFVKADIVRDVCQSGVPEAMNLRIDSIDYREDLTRVYGALIGKPHTANRIDSLTLELPTGEMLQCTDIDGVDMNRWFQWEDDGIIAVEIDFPKAKLTETLTIRQYGPKSKGNWIYLITR